MLTSVYLINSLSELGQCHNHRFLLFPFLFQGSFYVISILFAYMYESISLMTSKCWTRDLLQFLWNVTMIINVHYNYTYSTYTTINKIGHMPELSSLIKKKNSMNTSNLRYILKFHIVQWSIVAYNIIIKNIVKVTFLIKLATT